MKRAQRAFTNWPNIEVNFNPPDNIFCHVSKPSSIFCPKFHNSSALEFVVWLCPPKNSPKKEGLKTPLKVICHSSTVLELIYQRVKQGTLPLRNNPEKRNLFFNTMVCTSKELGTRISGNVWPFP